MSLISLFGGTGMTGNCVVQAGIEKGWKLKLLVRDPAKVPDNIKDKVELVKGDVLNLEDVKKAIEGSEAVVVTLGTRNNLGPTTVMSDGLKNILTAMEALNVKVVSVCLSAFLWSPPEKVPSVFLHVDKDHRAMLEHLKGSSLDWIAVYPPHIAGEPPSGELIVVHDKHPGPRVISKFTLGKFLLEATKMPEHFKKLVGIGEKTG